MVGEARQHLIVFKEILWQAIEDEDTALCREIRETTNLLLDLMDELYEQM